MFDGNARQAMTFYKQCLGGELEVQSFGDGPKECIPEGAPRDVADRVLHARLTSGPVVLMASDTFPGLPVQAGNNFKISIDCESLEEIERLFSALGEGGSVKMD